MTPWEQILKTAVRAPSPLNTQPWKLQIHSEVDATLFFDTSRRPPGHDCLSWCTMGIFIETLAIVANNEGWTLQDELVEPTGAGPLIPFARLNLKPVVQRKSLYTNPLVHRRQTSRLATDAKPLAPEAERRLQETAADWEYGLTFISDPTQTEAILERHIENTAQDLNAPDARAERLKWFRFSRRQARLRRDGLEARVLRLRSWQFWMLSKMPSVLRWRWVRRIYRRRLGHVETLGVLSGPFWEREWAIRAGRFLMRFWLEATRLDLSMHPFGNLITSPETAAWLNDERGLPNAWLVFRIGRTAVPPTSCRLRESDLLVNAEN